MDIDQEILDLINEKTLQISANFNKTANDLTEVIRSNLKNIDYKKYLDLLSRCERLIEKSEEWNDFQKEIKEMKELKEKLDRMIEAYYE